MKTTHIHDPMGHDGFNEEEEFAIKLAGHKFDLFDFIQSRMYSLECCKPGDIVPAPGCGYIAVQKVVTTDDLIIVDYIGQMDIRAGRTFFLYYRTANDAILSFHDFTK